MQFLRLKRGEDSCYQLEHREESESSLTLLLLCLGLDRFGQGPPILGGWPALLSLLKVVSSRNALTDTPQVMFHQVSGHHGPSRVEIQNRHHKPAAPSDFLLMCAQSLVFDC